MSYEGEGVEVYSGGEKEAPRFHNLGAATEKALSPYVFNLVPALEQSNRGPLV